MSLEMHGSMLGSSHGEVINRFFMHRMTTSTSIWPHHLAEGGLV